MRIPALIAALAGLAACTTTGQDQAERRPVSIRFALLKDGQPASCAAPLGALGVGKVPAILRDARFYVQDVALIDSSGAAIPVTLTANDWQIASERAGQVALIDFETGSGSCAGGTPATNTVITGSVPAGFYTGVSFTIGVPAALNHTSIEKSQAPLNSAAMNWSWQTGRKFMKIEADPAGGVRKPDGSTAPTWFFHLGSTECSGNPATGEIAQCKRPNRLPVTLAGFDPAHQAVALDLTSLFAASDIARDQGAAVGCMSGPTDADCPPIFGQLGVSLANGMPVDAGKSAIFRAVSK